jgi:hypothetical protein
LLFVQNGAPQISHAPRCVVPPCVRTGIPRHTSRRGQNI